MTVGLTRRPKQIWSSRVTGNINEYLGLDNVAQRYIGLEDAFFAIFNRFAQRLSISTEDLVEATAGLSQTYPNQRDGRIIRSGSAG